jgi:ectoine hydroxylase-related dioxygenase (phytanoyl-CoA dioxygenase family)
MSILTEQAIRQYAEEGYTVFRSSLFSEDDFCNLSRIFNQLNAERGEKRSDELDFPHFHCPELLKFLMNDNVLDLVEPLIGPDIGLWTSHFICKEPHCGRATPWHEDSTYWEGRFDRIDDIVTVWLAIDLSDQENGAMKVIPATHLNGGGSDYMPVDASENLFDTAIRDVDDTKAVTISLEPNQCSLHDARIIHGADANLSSRRRCGYTMRYFSQHMKFNAEHPSNQGWKLYHCRGRNPHDNPVAN